MRAIVSTIVICAMVLAIVLYGDFMLGMGLAAIAGTAWAIWGRK